MDHLYAAPVLTRYFSDMNLDDLAVVAPDAGSTKMARGFARRLGASLAVIDKRRRTANVAEVVNVVGEVEGRTCLIVDDMVDTAGTLTNGIYALKERGAAAVYACATHALLSGRASERLQGAPVEEVVVTNTIGIAPELRFPKLKVLSVAGLLSDAIRYIHSNASVSQLFRMPAREAPIVVEAADGDPASAGAWIDARSQSPLTAS